MSRFLTIIAKEDGTTRLFPNDGFSDVDTLVTIQTAARKLQYRIARAEIDANLAITGRARAVVQSRLIKLVREYTGLQREKADEGQLGVKWFGSDGLTDPLALAVVGAVENDLRRRLMRVKLEAERTREKPE